MMLKNIVSSQWLNKHLYDKNIVVLDATQQNKREKVEAKYKNVQIIGSRYFDIKNDFSDTKSRFPNTFPSKGKFEKSCRKLGINNHSIIVVYDTLGVFSSARVWWMFKTFGHEQVFVLNGGLPDWINFGFKTETIKKNNFKEGDFTANLNSKKVWSFTDIKNNINNKEYLVIDARSKERFKSLVSESRKGLRSGNIPNSVNLPYTDVLVNGKFKKANELEKIFAKFDQSKPFVFSCGSGITACVLLLAASLLMENTNKGSKENSKICVNSKQIIYDGSWTEFGTLEK